MSSATVMRHLRIFLSSPGDVAEERAGIRSLVESELAKERLFRLGARLEVVSWDDPHAPVPMDAHLAPQEAVNRGLPLPSQCDVVVILLWSRLGTPLPMSWRKPDGERYWSGTEYEYVEAISAKNKPRVLVYRCTASVEEAWRKSAFSEEEGERQEQYARVERFFSTFSASDGSIIGSYRTYSTVPELVGLIRLQLREVLQEILLGPSRLDFGIARIFQARTQAFCDEYIVSETGPIPFGGRDRELEKLDAWLNDSGAPSRMLVTGPAGRGKSALLVHWMKTLHYLGGLDAGGWSLVFMPISIRIGTNRPEVFYEGIARRLAEIIDEALPSEAIRDSDGFRYAIRDQIGRLARSDKQVLFVIDGLDEALHGSFDPAILPLILPTSIRVLVSARWQVGDSDSRGWRKRLGWARAVKADCIELEPLDREAIADVFVKLDAAGKMLARESALIEKLVELTGGEPLLIRYYAEDLWALNRTGVSITTAELDALKPGFASYFQRWFELQEALWRQENGGVDRHAVDSVLSILAFALGPLEASDILALFVRTHGPVPAVDRLLEPLRRFVIGDGRRGSGYILSHPKIGDYLRNERFLATAKELCRDFSAWGMACLSDINAGRVSAEQASPYVLQFLPQHLGESGAPSRDFMPMVEDGWRRAWRQLEGGHRGFTNSVRAAWTSVREDKAGLNVGARWRCALALSSIRSLGQNVNGKLALAATKGGRISIRQAAHFAEMKGPTQESIWLLSELASLAREDASLTTELSLLAMGLVQQVKETEDYFGRASLLSEAISVLFSAERGLAVGVQPQIREVAMQIIRSVNAPPSRVRLLTQMSRLIEGRCSGPMVQEAWETTASISLSNHLSRAQAFIWLLPVVDEPSRPDLIRQALDHTFQIENESFRLNPLAGLAPFLTAEQLSRALAASVAIGNEGYRSSAIAGLAPHLTQEQVSQALVSVRAIENGADRSRTLAAIAARLLPEQRRVVLDEALDSAKAITATMPRALALVALSPHLAGEQINEALAVAHAIDNAEQRPIALGALAPRLERDLRRVVLDEALADVRKISRAWNRGIALAALASRLFPEQLGEALALAKTIHRGTDRSIAFGALAPHLSLDQLDDVLANAMSIDDGAERSEALVILSRYVVPQIGEEFLAEALAAANDVGDEFARARALASLVPKFPPEQREKIIQEALVAAKAVGDESYRALALSMLAPHLTPSQASETATFANAIGSENGRASALAPLARRLAPEEMRAVLNDAFAAAMTVADEWRRQSSLAALVPHLGPDKILEAVASAREFTSDYYRSGALKMMAPYVAPDERKSVLDEALSAALACDSDSNLSYTLVGLVHDLAPRQVVQVLGTARTIKSQDHRARLLTALIPNVERDQRPSVIGEAVAAAKAIENEFPRSIGLAALVPHLAPDQRQDVVVEALAAAKAVKDGEGRSTALVTCLSIVPPDLITDVLDALIDTAGAIPRGKALSVAGRVAHATHQVEGRDAIGELRRAINDVCCWYP